MDKSILTNNQNEARPSVSEGAHIGCYVPELVPKNKILHLTLKKQWYDMILSGEKKEEYREIKEYWSKRLMNPKRKYSFILFKNGYGKNAPKMLVEIIALTIGIGIEQWGAPNGRVYKITLGEVIYTDSGT